MKKGISIPISTLVILAISIVAMLAIIAWFMGAFTPSGRQMSYQQKFSMSCRVWTVSNCAGNVPDSVCDAYNEMTGRTGKCDNTIKDQVARACGCTPPFGLGETTSTTSSTTTTV